MKVRIIHTESSFWHSSLLTQVVEVEEIICDGNDTRGAIYDNFYIVPDTAFNRAVIPFKEHSHLQARNLYILKSRTIPDYPSNKEAAILLSKE